MGEKVYLVRDIFWFDEFETAEINIVGVYRKFDDACKSVQDRLSEYKCKIRVPRGIFKLEAIPEIAQIKELLEDEEGEIIYAEYCGNQASVDIVEMEVQ